MNCCTHCGGKFGLVRFSHFRRQFCSKKCKQDFYAIQAGKLEAARKRWLAYLYPESRVTS